MNLLNIFQHGEVRYAFSGWAPPLGIEWVADGLASVMLVALSLLGLVTVIFAGPTSPKDLGGRIVHFYTLILLLISALTGIVFAGDLFNLFVFLEVAALASYALVGVAGGKTLCGGFFFFFLGKVGCSLSIRGELLLCRDRNVEYGRYGRATSAFIDLQGGSRRSSFHVYWIGN